MTLTQLPPGHDLVEMLAVRGPVRVARVRFGAAEAVCRIGGRGTDEVLAELAVLTGVSHPGLAELLDYGTLESGAAYVTRRWVEGCDLATWAEDRSADEILGAVAQLGGPLDTLHRAGFVHGDLKPENVLVGTDGRVVLADYGLTRSATHPSGPATSGSFFYHAPEILLGLEAGASRDLFALGAMLHELLVGRRIQSPREFYGRFPADDYFSATGTRPDELPESCRDIVTALLERDPSERPLSALAVGRSLARRSGQDVELASAALAPRVPTAFGRGAAVDAVLAKLGSGRCVWVELPAGERRSAWAEHLQLRAALGGVAARGVVLERAHAAAGNPAELEAWARDTAASCASLAVFTHASSRDPGPLAALASLARGVRRLGETLVVVSDAAPADAAWEHVRVPAFSERNVRDLLANGLAEPAADRLDELAARLCDEAGGDADALESILDAGFGAGWLLPGERRPVLRPGPLPRPLGTRAAPPIDLEHRSPLSLCLLAAVWIAGDVGNLREIAEIAGIEPKEAHAEVSALLADGIARRVSGGRLHLAAGLGPDRLAASLGPETWRAMHGRRARQLERREAALRERLPHACVAWPDASAREALSTEMRRLREVGRPELALDLAMRVEELDRATDGEASDVWVAERAACWCSLGWTERALAVLDELAGHPASTALRARVRGLVATSRQDYAAAYAELTEAADADPRWRGEADVARANLLFYGQRDDELESWWASREAEGLEDLQQRQVEQILSLVALSRFRRGDAAGARELLRSLVDRAVLLGDELREAGLRISLATVERRSGNPEGAKMHLESAAALYERVGALAGLAQARTTLAGVLRELGHLIEAEPLLESALEQRESLGDRAGAFLTRAGLALHYADRGHAAAAAEELTRCIEGIEGPQRGFYVPVLEGKLFEQRARLARPAAPPEVGSDPRALAACARGRWIRGDRRDARGQLEELIEVARERSATGPLLEGQFLLQALDTLPASLPAAGPEERRAPLVASDRSCLRVLAAKTLPIEEATRLARTLEASGRDDRAARLWCAIASRSGDVHALESARRTLARCTRGTTEEEARALRRHLLGIPDPWPEDLLCLEAEGETLDDFDMDVLKLLEINRQLVEQADLHTLLGAIVEHALSVSGAQRGFLMLEDHGRLRFDTALDSRRGAIGEPELEVSRSVIQEALDRQRPLRLNDAIDDPLVGASASVRSLDLHSVLCVPFRVSPDLRGVLYVDHRDKAEAFPERTERLLQLLADQASLAIRQVRRIMEIRELNERLEREVVEKESDLRSAQHALSRVGVPTPVGGLVGNSAAMRSVHRVLHRAAETPLPVLVTGDSGTGKELAARAVHDLGGRSHGPFVPENCAAIPESLFESELFGHKKGAFTGADTDRTGLFERAHGGTLFLDEIGEMPLALQAKLLRVLETSEVRRLGDDDLRTVDFRLVVATNRDLEAEVAAGTFRADLYYRLNGLRVHLPPLAERTEDIPALVDHFLRLEASNGRAPRVIQREVLAALCRRPWPGNVRELSNEIARLCALCEGELNDPTLVRSPNTSPGKRTSVVPLAELERTAILNALETTGGDKREAAKQLGISRAKIYQRLKEWGEGPALPRRELK